LENPTKILHYYNKLIVGPLGSNRERSGEREEVRHLSGRLRVPPTLPLPPFYREEGGGGFN
jgi:hypothetical protein